MITPDHPDPIREKNLKLRKQVPSDRRLNKVIMELI